MLVFWDQRLVLLATPKTGSTSLASVLEPYAAISVQRPPLLKHTNAQRYHRFIGPYLKAASGESFTTLALMREPVDWLGSWYRFRQRPEVSDPQLSTRDMSFERFVEAYCETPQPGFAAVGSQSRFLTPEGKPPVDRIFPYERMELLLAFLEERLGRRIALPRLNISPPVELALSRAGLTRLQERIAPEIALHRRISQQG